MLKTLNYSSLFIIIIEFFFAFSLSNEDNLSRIHSFVPLYDYSKENIDIECGYYLSNYSRYIFISSNLKASQNLILSTLFAPASNETNNYLYYKLDMAYLSQYQFFPTNKNIISLSSHSLYYYNTKKYHWFNFGLQSILENKKFISSIYWARYFSDLWYNNHVGFSLGFKNIYNFNIYLGIVINNMVDFSFSNYISIKLNL